MAIKITKNGTAGAQDGAPAAKTYQEGSSQGKASGRIKITKIERPQTTAKQKWTVGNIGQYGAGNIDLYDRPQYRNANGSISTVDSTSYNIDGQEVLLPTVWNRNGTPYHSSNDEEILQRYRDTGEYLGKFSTVEEANDYAEKLHLEQQERYPSSSLPAERGSKHKSGKEISQSIVRNEDAAKRIGATVRATAQNLGANASGFLAALVAAALKFGGEEDLNDALGHIFADHAGAHGEHIGVVVAADQRGDLGLPAQSGADPLVLVERHGHAFARAAEGDALRQLARLDRFGQRVGEVGVVDALGRVGAEIEHLIAHGVEVTHQEFFHFIARVVAGDTYFLHRISVYSCSALQRYKKTGGCQTGLHAARHGKTIRLRKGALRSRHQR